MREDVKKEVRYLIEKYNWPEEELMKSAEMEQRVKSLRQTHEESEVEDKIRQIAAERNLENYYFIGVREGKGDQVISLNSLWNDYGMEESVDNVLALFANIALDLGKMAGAVLEGRDFSELTATLAKVIADGIKIGIEDISAVQGLDDANRELMEAIDRKETFSAEDLQEGLKED